MKKIKVGIAKEIDFKVYSYDKIFELRNIPKNNFNFDVIIITSSTKISHKIINKYKNLKVIFIMSLHLLSRIKLDKLRKDIKIIYFDKKSKKVLQSITPTPEFIFGLITLLSKNFLNCKFQLKKNNWDPKNISLSSAEKMLSLSTLGIVGYGRIGKKLEVIAKKFGMKTLIFSNKKSKRHVTLDKIAKGSDYITDGIHPKTIEEKKLVETLKRTC